MIEYNTLVVMAGVTLLGATGGLVGSFAILRRRALVGDALAHASLPGVCLAFLLWERRELYLLLAGAMASGLAGVLVVATLRRFTRIKEDAAIGIVLSVFFGLGIVLSRIVQNRSMAASKAGLDSFLLGKTAGMVAMDVYLIAAAASLCGLVALALFKEFKAITFDPGFSQAQGWPVFFLDLLILSLIAVTVMIGLPAVGVVLVAALLILPAAAARFWTERFTPMVMLASAFGAATGIGGTLASARFSGFPAGPVIVLNGTVLLVLSLLAAPRRGIVARLVSDARFQRQLSVRAILRELYAAEEASKTWPVASATRRQRAALRRLAAGNLIRPRGDTFELTDEGKQRARSIIATDRLWRQLLLDDPELAASADLSRESLDGLLPPDAIRAFAEKLRDAGQWPSGEPLPGSIVAGGKA